MNKELEEVIKLLDRLFNLPVEERLQLMKGLGLELDSRDPQGIENLLRECNLRAADPTFKIEMWDAINKITGENLPNPFNEPSTKTLFKMDIN